MPLRTLSLAVMISAGLLAGCSNEPSAQEKRNLFDKCVLDYIEDNSTYSISEMAAVERDAPFKCKHLLD